MARRRLTPHSGLEHVLVANRPAKRDSDTGVTIALRGDLSLAMLSVRRDQTDALVSRVRELFGLDLVNLPRCVNSGPIAFVWAGPGQWLAMGAGADGAAFEQRLRDALGHLASVSDQSDGRTIIRVGGDKARDALAKGVPIDLHPREFRPGDAAVTIVANIGAQIWQVDEKPTYEFIISRSVAAVFLEWLIGSATEFGVRLTNQVVS
jgi:methylglutamate dehydrogenase subunit D